MLRGPRLLRPLIGFALTATAGAAFSWIDTGHMVVADIAYRNLTPAVRRKVDALLKTVGSDFVTGSTWADDTRNRASGPWHYINYHFRTDGKRTSNKPEAENVVWAINKFSAVLKDASATTDDRANALRYVIHFVADAHQPLHCVARDSDEHPNGDRGGNDFTLGKMSWLKSRRPNLHFLWDVGGGLLPRVDRPLDANGRRTLAKLSSDILKGTPPTAKQVAVRNATSWALEGLALAKRDVYNLTEGSVPSSAYLATCKRDCSARLALAGKRLAALLNRQLG